MVLLDLYYQFISFVYLLKIVGMYLNIVAGILLYLYRCIVDNVLTGTEHSSLFVFLDLYG